MKIDDKPLSRRKFIGKVGSATAAFTLIPRHVMAGHGYMQPSDTVNIAVIGLGMRGSRVVQDICTPDQPIVSPLRHPRTGIPYTRQELKEMDDLSRQRTISQAAGPAAAGRRDSNQLANIYALCDVDTEFAGHVFKGYPRAKIYTDWRELLEKEKSNVDAVVISTPDHTHATIAAAFIREKKHVYIEKPLAKTPYECRKIAELAKEYDVVTQLGNQFHADEYTRQTVELIQSGAIGHVREVLVTKIGVPPWPQGNISRPEGYKAPSHINYDAWIGPAPMKPYHPLTFHNQWRGLWDYGTNTLGDWSAHYLDPAWWALNLDRPIRVQSSCTEFSDEYYPEAVEITYEFAARGHNPPVRIVWRDGGLKTPRPIELEPGRPLPVTIYVGDKGYLCGARGIAPSFIPDNPHFDFPEPWIPRTGNIYEEWFDAIKSNTKTTNDFSYSSKIIESSLLGNIAHQMQNANMILEYDGESGNFSNSEEANALLHYEYRKGWSI